MARRKEYNVTVSISTNKKDTLNRFDFNLIFGGRNASYFRVTNDDSTNSIFFLIDDINCYPGPGDIEVKAGETWPSRENGSYSGIRLVADTSAVTVRIYAEP